MKTKRILALLIVFAMVSMMLAGCGAQQNSGASSVSVETDSTAEGTDAQIPSATEAAASADTALPEASTEEIGNTYPLCEEKTELSLLCAYMMDFMSAGLVEDIEDFAFIPWMEDLTNVHIDFHVVGDIGNFMDQLALMVASGDMTDMFTAVGAYPGGALSGIQNDELVNVYPYLETCAPDYWNLLKQSDLNLMMATLDDGVMGGIYLLRENGGATNGIAVRQDWLDDLNIEKPETYDEFAEMLRAFKQEYNCSSPFILTNELQSGSALTGGFGTSGFTTGQNTQQYMLSFYQVDGTVYFSPLQEGYKKYISLMHDWYEEGLISRDFVSYGVASNETNTWFYDGTAGATVMRGDAVSTAILGMTDENAVIGGLQFPVENKGDTYHFVDTHYISQNTTIGITTACQDVEIALMWLNTFFDDDYKYALNFGTDGTTYEVVDDKIQLTDVVLNNEWDVSASAALSVFSACGKMFPILETAQYEEVLLPEEAMEIRALASVGDDAYILPSISANADDLEEYNSIYSDLSTYIMENSTRFIIGERDMSEWDAYCDEIRDLGGERVQEIMQTSYDLVLKNIK